MTASTTPSEAPPEGPPPARFAYDVHTWKEIAHLLVNLPIGVAAWWIAGHTLVESRAPGHRRMPDVRGALLLAVTPVQPWYAVSLLAVATVAARPAWSAVAVAGYPYFFAVLLDSPHAVAIGRTSYGLALAVLVVARWKYSPRLSERSNDADRASAGDRGAGDDGVHGVRGR